MTWRTLWRRRWYLLVTLDLAAIAFWLERNLTVTTYSQEALLSEADAAKQPARMLVLVCGSRTWERGDLMTAQLKALPRGAIVMHGACRGADLMADTIARRLGFTVWQFPVNWHTGVNGGYNPRAGRERNLVMLDERPDLVLAFHRDGSTGTQHVIDEARRRRLRLVVVSA